jgi:sugar-specific transcriptional regulator TrmB
VARPGSGLLELLGDLGIPEKGARVYLAACRAGPQTASELGRLSAVNRVEAYRFIKQLSEAGLLIPNGGRPQRFAALAPEEMVDRTIRRASDRLHRLEADREKVLSGWEESRTELDDRDPRKFAVLEGRGTIYRFLQKRIGTAQRQVLLSTGGRTLATFLEGGIDRALREAGERGVKVRVLTEVYPPSLGPAKHFAGFSELRHSSNPVVNRAVVIDRVGALVYVSGEDEYGPTHEEQVALWSSAPMFVHLARDNYRRMWAPAMRAEVRFVELEHPMGGGLAVVAGKESVPFQRLKEIAKLGMRASGVKEFQLQLPELIETIARQLGREIADQVDGATPQKVAASLSEYYETHTLGHLAVVKAQPLTLQVTACFACTPHSPEIGRMMCPQLLRTVLESRLGHRWDVTKPDPTKHATRGCVFTATAA